MRDLQADKKIWEDAWVHQGYSDCAYIANTILPHAIERAIKAEAEAERYKLMVKSITGGLDEAIETVHYLETENALLRKVEEKTELLINGLMQVPVSAEKCSKWAAWLDASISEYRTWQTNKPE